MGSILIKQLDDHTKQHGRHDDEKKRGQLKRPYWNNDVAFILEIKFERLLVLAVFTPHPERFRAIHCFFLKGRQTLPPKKKQEPKKRGTGENAKRKKQKSCKMDTTLRSLLLASKGDVDKAIEAFLESEVLITVPHAHSVAPLITGHDSDFVALEAAQVLESEISMEEKKCLLHVGHMGRHQQADLNRTETHVAAKDRKSAKEREDWHALVRWWAILHPEGLLIDVHSFPQGFDWQNNTTTELKGPTYAEGPLVVLLPVENSEFGQRLADELGVKSVYQGTEVNAIINMGGKNSVLLEFEEESPRVTETAQRVARALYTSQSPFSQGGSCQYW
jgi:hypothetical protein